MWMTTRCRLTFREVANANVIILWSQPGYWETCNLRVLLWQLPPPLNSLEWAEETWVAWSKPFLQRFGSTRADIGLYSTKSSLFSSLFPSRSLTSARGGCLCWICSDAAFLSVCMLPGCTVIVRWLETLACGLGLFFFFWNHGLSTWQLLIWNLPLHDSYKFVSGSLPAFLLFIFEVIYVKLDILSRHALMLG